MLVLHTGPAYRTTKVATEVRALLVPISGSFVTGMISAGFLTAFSALVAAYLTRDILSDVPL